MPALTISPNAATDDSLTVNITNLAADGAITFQYSSRADFRNCVAPAVSVPPASPLLVPGLNAGSLYFVRARSVRADGSVEDWSNILALKTLAGSARSTAPNAVMIQPAMIVVPAAILSSDDLGEGVAGFPIDNLFFDGPVGFRTVETGGVYAFVVEVGDEAIDTIAVLSTNCSPDATITIKAGSTAAGLDFTTGPLPFRASANLPQRPGFHALVQLPSPERRRFWRIEITDDLLSNVLHAEHFVLGLNRATRNHSVNKTEQGIDLGLLDRSRDGNPIRAAGFRHRQVDFEISMLTEEQYELSYADLDHAVGSTLPVLCVPNSIRNAFFHDRILYGAISSGRVVSPASPRFTRGFAIQSVI